MSVAYEFDFAPRDLVVSDLLRQPRGRRPLAEVVQLRAPREAAPLRLTHRGRVVVWCAVALLAAAVTAAALVHGPRAGSAGSGLPSGSLVTVGYGESLWVVAEKVAPGRDPRAVVVDLQRINHLAGSTVQPGEVLLVP